MAAGLAECDRLRGVVALAVDALDWSDAMQHPDDAIRHAGKARAARAAFEAVAGEWSAPR